jgi:FkbM family methyltransferase
MKLFIRKVIYKLALIFNVRLPAPKSLNNMGSALSRLAQVGVDPQIVIDAGAAKGIWTKQALKIWPNAQYELIEPLEEQKSISLVKNLPNCHYNLCALGNEKGYVNFSVSSDLDGSGIYAEGVGEKRTVPVNTINDICKDTKGDILIKLDTHGYELPILEGASDVLARTTAMVIEVYGFYVSPTGPLFHELSAYLEEKGFRLFDVVDVMRRKKDNSFWQADAVYLPASHPIFNDNKYI